MSIKVVCPQCRKALTAPDTAAGKTATCPNCRSKVAIPSGIPEAILVARPIPPAAAPVERPPISIGRSAVPVVTPISPIFTPASPVTEPAPMASALDGGPVPAISVAQELVPAAKPVVIKTSPTEIPMAIPVGRPVGPQAVVPPMPVRPSQRTAACSPADSLLPGGSVTDELSRRIGKDDAGSHAVPVKRSDAGIPWRQVATIVVAVSVAGLLMFLIAAAS